MKRVRKQFFMTLFGINIHIRKNSNKLGGVTITVFEKPEPHQQILIETCLEAYLILEGFLESYPSGPVSFDYSFFEE